MSSEKTLEKCFWKYIADRNGVYNSWKGKMLECYKTCDGFNDQCETYSPLDVIGIKSFLPEKEERGDRARI